MAKQKRYNKDFKLQAARLVTEQGYSFREAGERLAVSAWSIDGSAVIVFVIGGG